MHKQHHWKERYVKTWASIIRGSTHVFICYSLADHIWLILWQKNNHLKHMWHNCNCWQLHYGHLRSLFYCHYKELNPDLQHGWTILGGGGGGQHVWLGGGEKKSGWGFYFARAMLWCYLAVRIHSYIISYFCTSLKYYIIQKVLGY